MATRDLVNLEKCSGLGGTSGESFKSNVLGATSGAWMKRDYRITGWEDWGSDPPSQGSPGPTFDSGQVFDLSTIIAGGSRISYITRTGSGLVTITNISKPDSGSVTLQSSAVANTPGLNVAPAVDASVKIVSGTNGGTVPGLAAGHSCYYNGSDQSSPPTDGSYCQLHFFAAVSGGGASDGGYDDVSFTLQFDPNAGTGAFNDVLSESFSMRMQHRGVSTADYTIEWHDNDTYTHLVGGGSDYYANEAVLFPDFPPGGSGYTLWMRYQMPGGGSWVNVGAVTSTDDTRISYS